MIWILDHSFDGLLLHTVYIFKLLAFFSDMGLSRMEIMPSMQKSTLLLYIVVWSCQIFYIIKVMPFCNRTFQTYAPASSTAGQSCVGQWQNQTSHQNLDFGYSEQYYEEIDLQNHVTQYFFPIFLSMFFAVCI